MNGHSIATEGLTRPTQPPQPAPPNTIFRGSNGIRAGWRVLIFLVLTVVIGFLLVTPLAIISNLHKGVQGGNHARISGTGPLALGVTEAVLFLSTALAALIMSRIEHRKWGEYGLPPRWAFGKDFWVGTVIGFLAISVCLFGIFLLHGFHLEGLATRGQELVSATLAWTLTFVLVGLAEEFSFRGYLQYTLTTGIGFWPAAILLSLLFAAAHSRNPGESAAGLLSIPVFALLFCLILRRTGNLWWAVGFHAGWDWGQTFFYGVRDSGVPAYHNLFNSSFSGPNWLTGGTVGPEASVFTPIVLIIVGVVFASIYREKNYRTYGETPQNSD